MSVLFCVSGNEMRALAPTSFPAGYLGNDLQLWGDVNSHFLNEGAPILSLGREIGTRHGHTIENLFVDGCLVLAELKRDNCAFAAWTKLDGVSV